jgi:glycerol kinase
MENDTGITLPELRVDGGASANNLLMQIQADLLGVPVVRARIGETTALGAAFLAGLAVGYWRDRDEAAACIQHDRTFVPAREHNSFDLLYRGWNRSLQRARNWDENSES